MSAQAESALSNRIRRRLEREWPRSWWVKTSGNNRVGTPDLLGCVEGVFIALEVKMPGGEATRLQQEVMRRLERAGGYAATVTGQAEAVTAVAEALVAAAETPLAEPDSEAPGEVPGSGF